MKKMVFGILLGFMLLVTSCFKDDDGYSLNNYWVGFGIVHFENEESGNFNITMDNGDVLLPIQSGQEHSGDYHFSNAHIHVNNGDRILLNYTIIGEEKGEGEQIEAFYVTINSAKKVLTKHIMDITPENEDSIGNDPIEVTEVWMTDSLLNFKLKYWGNREIHFINMVKEPGVVSAVNQPIELELRHNANNDDESIYFTAHVSFKLNNLQIEGQDSVTFNVSATDYNNGNFNYQGTYIYRIGN